MSSSMQGAKEVIRLETFDCTKECKQILRQSPQETGDKNIYYPLIEVDPDQHRVYILSDFNRGAVRIVNGKIFSNKTSFPIDAAAQSLLSEEEQGSALEKYLSLFSIMNPDFAVIEKYNSQGFSSVANRLLVSLFEGCPGLYKFSFSAAGICHFWKENIDGEDNLCMLILNSNLSIFIPASFKEKIYDDIKYYIPGTMAVELKVPVSVLSKKEAITEEHLTKVLVTSAELRDLLTVDDPKKCRQLTLAASKEEIKSPEVHMIKSPCFREHLYGMVATKETVKKIIELLIDLSPKVMDRVKVQNFNSIKELAQVYKAEFDAWEKYLSLNKIIEHLFKYIEPPLAKSSASFFGGMLGYLQQPKEVQLYELLKNFVEKGNGAEKLIAFLEKNQAIILNTGSENKEGSDSDKENKPNLCL